MLLPSLDLHHCTENTQWQKQRAKLNWNVEMTNDLLFIVLQKFYVPNCDDELNNNIVCIIAQRKLENTILMLI